jgi:hypothetical protein
MQKRCKICDKVSIIWDPVHRSWFCTTKDCKGTPIDEEHKEVKLMGVSVIPI